VKLIKTLLIANFAGLNATDTLMRSGKGPRSEFKCRAHSTFREKIIQYSTQKNIYKN